ncbi:MAG: SEC-C metal-binding domain-containing protein, partial [Thermodesulfobacteriota bacterium]
RPAVEEMIEEKAEEIAFEYADETKLPEDWDLSGLDEAIFKQFNFRLGLDADAMEGLDAEALAGRIYDHAIAVYNEKENEFTAENLRKWERFVMLQTVDNLWKDHLLSMDHLKEGIGLRGYAQQNPLLVYKKEGFEMFNHMIGRVKEETISILFRTRIERSDADLTDRMEKPSEKDLVFSGGDRGGVRKEPVKRSGQKIGRNAPCPCGSGKKYKKCCGR